ncbi:hypothetical protein ASC75_07165 [Aminobacter sp. DSM 101952]|uniref:LpxI family protein n=1 Tax=Aminobacter sp. DSM 101952 TaxID=2735891 RepID=UPI0006FFDDDC|nr:UDP-2,3-diacylglucosamine diphosphatase LpxI [Aminobacter sp. DSM 101952]KQU69917.1 hypothetical protein ASC75_07165 [Aminobacter sp. DSM 101952]
MTKAEGGKRIDLSATDRIAVVAGSGRLPVNVADSLADAGHAPFIVLIDGETDPGTSLWGYEGKALAIEQFASLVPLLKRERITHLVLAGGISRRPVWRAIRPSVSLFRILPRALAGLARGDDGLLRTLVSLIEDNGIKVVGAHQVVPNLLATEGRIGAHAPQDGDWADLRAGLEAARAIGALDIGQAAVAIGGRAIALEGVEGTDLLLERVRDLRTNGRIAGRKRGVLVKCAKPGQEMRADLPTIGPATVDAAHAAGLAGIGVEAGRSFVLDVGDVVERADRLGLFVVGVTGERGNT